MQALISSLITDNTAPELIALISAITDTCKLISHTVRQGAIAGCLGATDTHNSQGEKQQSLDVIANQLLKETLQNLAVVRSIASEEEPTTVACQAVAPFIVAFDPLDGSTNIAINGQIGTIFSIFAARNDVSADNPAQFYQLGKTQVCAGYVLYGPATELVITSGGPTRGFTLDRQSDQFVLTKPKLTIDEHHHEFAINMANLPYWRAHTRRYIDELLQGQIGPTGNSYNMRWNGAMVGDVHRVLSRGGIFLYPEDNREKRKQGKLRLLYEAMPMALLTEQAGGAASNGRQAILDLTLANIHQKTPVIIGDKTKVSHYIKHNSANVKDTKPNNE